MTEGTGDRAAYVAMPGGPQITRVRYDAGILGVSWLANPNPATTFVVNVFAGNFTIAAVDAGQTMNAWLPIDLPPGHDYTVAVESRQGAAHGPWSQSVDIVLDTLAIASAETDPATGRLTLGWTAEEGAQFRLRLVVNGSSPDPESLVDGGAATLAPPPAGSVAAAALAVVVESNEALSIGPFGPGFALPTGRPDLTALDFDGATLHAAWTAVPGAAGYRVTVLDGAAVVTSAGVAAPATRCDLALASPPSGCVAVVQALHANGSGPASAPLAVLSGVPAITATTCDGEVLTLAVTAPGGTSPTAYDVTVLRDGAPVRAATLAGPLAMAVDWPVPAGAAHTVSVRARVGRTSGPAVTAPAVVATPAVESVACGTALLVTAGPGALPAAGLAIDAALYTDGRPGTPQRVGADGTTTFAIPAGAAAVAVRGVEGVATGPWSVPVPAPTTPPVITAVRCDGGRAALAWTGARDATFRVAVTAGNDVTETLVTGTSATLPCTGSPATATVTEVRGVAAGPVVPVDLVSEGPRLLTATTQAGRVVTIPWTPPASPAALTAVQPVVRWDATEAVLDAVPPATQPVILTLPADVPNGATVALRAIAGVATGPLGNAATLLTVAPTGLAVTYDGATVVATWDAATDPRVDRYAVTFAAPGADPIVDVAERLTARFAYAPETAPATPPTVTVAAMAGDNARGVACAPVDVTVTPPAVTSAVYDGAALDLRWTGTAAAYRVRIASGATVTHQIDVGEASAALALPPAAWVAEVCAIGEATSGPAARVRPVTGMPAVTAAAFDAVSGDCTVAWTPVDGATGYDVAVRDSTGQVHAEHVTGTTCTVPAATFRTGDAYTVTVRATASTATARVAGPAAAAPLPATAPGAPRVAYDGATLRASWEAVAAPWVTGYRVSTVTGGVAAHLGDTTATTGSWPLAAAATDAGSVVVQALAGGDAGAPSAPAALFTPALFLGDGYLAPQASPAPSPETIVLSLPDLFTKPPDPSALQGLDPVLGLALAPAPAPYAYTLTIPATSAVWTFGKDRVDVVAAWAAFVTKLQTDDKLKATAYGVLALQEAVSRAMPQTFAESLYFAYGLQFGRGCFDLRPGVVVRVEYEGFQVLGQTSEQASLSGYVTTAVADYEVASYQGSGRWLNGLDAFAAALATQGVTVPPAGSPGTGRAYGAGGLLDTFSTTLQAPFCRVVYPGTFLATTSPGSTFPQFNAVLLAGATFGAVETATANVRNGAPPGNGVAAVYLRGRTVVRALVRVAVDGAERLVPLGTTVGNVLAAAGRRPWPVDRPLAGVSLRRARAAAVTDPDADAGTWAVRLDWSPGSPGWLDLPLLHGDALDIGATA